MPKTTKMTKRMKKVSMKPEESKPKVTVAQLRILLEAIENDPSMFSVKGSEKKSFENVKKWTELGEKLNQSLGATIPVANWKYVLRYWCMKTQTRAETKAKKSKKPKPTQMEVECPKEYKELQQLEKRLIKFLKNEEAKKEEKKEKNEDLDITNTGGTGTDSNNEDAKLILQVLEMFAEENHENHENTPPVPAVSGYKRRCRVTKKIDRTDPTGKTVKYNIVYDRLGPLTAEERALIEAQKEKYRVIAEGIAENIAMINQRIQMIKDMWKHRCGDN